MQQALPYRNWLLAATSAAGSAAPPPGNANPSGGSSAAVSFLKKVVSENSVVVFARRGCCMCHVVKLLLRGHGVDPSIFDVDERNEAVVTLELAVMTGKPAAPQFPAVFVGGELFGGVEDLMGAHISGELVPRLKEARALWL